MKNHQMSKRMKSIISNKMRSMYWWMMQSIASKKLNPMFSRKMNMLLCVDIPYLISTMILLSCNNQMKVMSYFNYISQSSFFHGLIIGCHNQMKEWPSAF